MLIDRETGKRVANAAKQYINVPHVNANANKRGVDCATLCLCSAIDAGVIPESDVSEIKLTYPDDWFLHGGNLLLEAIERYCERLSGVSDLQAGDILVYRFGRAVSHAGIYIDAETIIHADGRVGRVVYTPLDNEQLQKRFYAAYRLRGRIDK